MDFQRGRFVIDGAMATELERRGADLNDPLWSAKVLLEQPALIEAVHFDYFVAGADIATTASYQATFAGFAARGLGDAEARRLLQLSVDLACAARERLQVTPTGPPRPHRPLVAASIGPYGAHLHDGSEYRGDYRVSSQALRDFHRRQLEVLAATKADLVAFETIPSLAEGEAIVRLLEEFPGVSAWLAFSCRDEAHLSHGERFTDCAALANERNGVVAVGLNCTAPRFVEALLRAASTVTKKPLLAYPNSGERWDASRQTWAGDAERCDFKTLTPRWLDAGARLVGGCCRTTPDDIRSIRSAVDGWVRRSG